jgi:hypothetical protein
MSRDKSKKMGDRDFWGVVTRAVKGAAQRSNNLQEFLDLIGERFHCSSLSPRYTGGDDGSYATTINPETGEVIVSGNKTPGLLAEIVENCDHKSILKLLAKETMWIVTLVRERIYREREAARLGGDQDEGVEADDEA